MSLLRIVCPTCGSEQTSPHGFVAGEVVRCRRCDASFQVPNRVTASLADEELPAERRSSTWLLGAAVLVVVAVIGVGVYAAVVMADRARAEQMEAEREAQAARQAEQKAALQAKMAKAANRDGQGGNPLAGLLGAGQMNPAQAKQAADALAGKLVGTWAGNGREVEYKADGTFRDGALAGTWKAVAAKGTKVLTVERSAGRSPLRVTFEGDELIHDAAEAGVSHVLRKK